MTQEELRAAFEQRVSNFKHSFESATGKKVYEYLSKFCFDSQSTFNASSQSTSNFNEGSRFVILEIKKWVNMDSAGIEEIIAKILEREKNYD